MSTPGLIIFFGIFITCHALLSYYGPCSVRLHRSPRQSSSSWRAKAQAELSASQAQPFASSFGMSCTSTYMACPYRSTELWVQQINCAKKQRNMVLYLLSTECYVPKSSKTNQNTCFFLQIWLTGMCCLIFWRWVAHRSSCWGQHHSAAGAQLVSGRDVNGGFTEHDRTLSSDLLINRIPETQKDLRHNCLSFAQKPLRLEFQYGT